MILGMGVILCLYCSDVTRFRTMVCFFFLSANIGGNGGLWVQIIKIRVIVLSKITLPWCRLPQTYHH